MLSVDLQYMRAGRLWTRLLARSSLEELRTGIRSHLPFSLTKLRTCIDNELQRSKTGFAFKHQQLIDHGENSANDQEDLAATFRFIQGTTSHQQTDKSMRLENEGKDGPV